jgi:hypothetical protein
MTEESLSAGFQAERNETAKVTCRAAGSITTSETAMACAYQI